MKNNVTEGTLHQTIIKNIRRLRIAKNISSKEMAYDIGMKPPEYSKLEKGIKRNLDKWISKIVLKLGVEKYELMMEDVENKNKRRYMSAETTHHLEKQKDEYLRLFKELDENDKVKKALIKSNEETIRDLKHTLKYWQNKYYRLKTKLVDAENSIKEFMKKSFHKGISDTAQSSSSLGNVGGGRG